MLDFLCGCVIRLGDAGFMNCEFIDLFMHTSRMVVLCAGSVPLSACGVWLVLT